MMMMMMMLESCGDDILEEILIRLPLKTIFRSKCVSKRWLNLISNPCFGIKRYRNFRGSGGLLGFFQTKTFFSNLCTWRFRPINIPKVVTPEEEEEEAADVLKGLKSLFNTLTDRHPRLFNFICSSNGLYLCNKATSNGTIYYVMNPLSKVVYQLPPSPKQMKFRELRPQGRSCVGLVAGDDDDSYGRYKMVRAEAVWGGGDRPLGSNLIEIETFSSDTGEWELFTVPVSVDVYNCFLEFRLTLQKVTVIKGVIHWMSCPDSTTGIITFDPFNNNNNNNVIGIIKPPPCCKERFCGFFFVLGESKDGLLQIAVLNQRSSWIGVWVFHSDCCEWSLRRRVSALPYYEYPFIRRHSESEPPLTLVAFHPHTPDALIINVGGSIFVCDLTTATPTPVLGEPLLQLPDNQCAITTVILQPYTLPPWPISPLPSANAFGNQKQTYLYTTRLLLKIGGVSIH